MSTAVGLVQCTCGCLAYPAQSLNERFALVPTCPKCGSEHRDLSVNDMMQTPIMPEKAKIVSIANPLRLVLPSTEYPTSSPTDVIALVRARILFLDAELAKREAYATEKKQLQRMLKAAEKDK